MLNGRLYRAGFVPFLFALAIAAFSLTARQPPLRSTLAPDAFEGAPAFAQLRALAREFPDRRPGSAGDQALAARVASTLRDLGGTAGGGFSVRTRRFGAQTIDGRRTLTTVIAQRPGSTGDTPIVILAHRDAAARGALAELSGTAALLELARVFAARETRRTIVLVSTSGGSGGAAGAADFAANAHGPFDAAIVLGDLASVRERKPLVVPYSDGFGSAPAQLQRTLADAITQETGADPGGPSALGQLAHMAFPLTAGEQGQLNAQGLPALLLQVSGERGPAPHAAVSMARLEAFGRSALSAVDALDAAPNVSSAMQTGLLVQHKTVPAWALRLLAATLLLPVLIALVDGLARVLRRRQPVRSCVLWALTCALPFLLGALFAWLLGAAGILSAAPGGPALPGGLPFDAAAAASVLSVALVFALGWLAWPALLRRLGLRPRPDSDAAALSALLVLLAVGALAWALNPYAALLALPALHLWLLVVDPELRPRPSASLGVIALGLLPLGALIAFYAHQLGLGPGGVAQNAVLLLAGGHVSIPAALLWSLALGAATATAIAAAALSAPPPAPAVELREEITIRGPLSYAGPGSLGGTKSALRR